MRKGVAVILLLAAMLLPGVMLGVENERQLAWGVNAVVLKSPWSGALPWMTCWQTRNIPSP